MTVLYGIANCDTIRRARRWLDEEAIEYRFHDYRKDGIDADTLAAWSAELGWEALLNRRGTTWRKLPEALKADIDEEQAIRLMREHPSIIKRPVLDTGSARHVGFDADVYRSLLT